MRYLSSLCLSQHSIPADSCVHYPYGRSVHVAGLDKVFPELILPPPPFTLHTTSTLLYRFRLLLCLYTYICEHTTMVSTDHRRKHASFSGWTVTVMSINAEGFSSVKGHLIGKICHEIDCDIRCLQETHRSLQQCRPKVPGMKLVVERPHEKYGSAIFNKRDTIIDKTSLSDKDNVEILTVSLGKLSVTSMYKLLRSTFSFPEPETFNYQQVNVIIGDFNSHSTSWDYNNSNNDGILLEEWAESHQLHLVHDAKLPPSINSCRWRRGYNPDLLFTSERISALSKKNVLDPIPHSQHRPIVIDVTAAVVPQKVPLRRRFNFRKDNW